MGGAIDSEIGGVFIPVRNIEAARDWYCRLLERPVDRDIEHGHLYVIPMTTGTGLVLDSKRFAGPHTAKPVFHFKTGNLDAARAHVASIGAGAVSPISDGIFFTFTDPDGNLLMVADVPSVAPYQERDR